MSVQKIKLFEVYVYNFEIAVPLEWFNNYSFLNNEGVENER